MDFISIASQIQWKKKTALQDWLKMYTNVINIINLYVIVWKKAVADPEGVL